MPEAKTIAIRAHGLTHRYGQETALKNIELELQAGMRIGLLGPDGVGKSTLLGLLAGVKKLQMGHLEILGEDLSRHWSRQQPGPRIAYMPQGLGKNLYADLSIAENLSFFGRLFGLSQHERAQRIANLTRATGLQPFLNRPAGKLSGGMKQKLGLCCALIHNPDLLILDEPTTGIDPLSRQQFWSLITSITSSRPNMTLLVATAYMDEAAQFDWLVAMNDGHIIGTGTPLDLMAQTKTEDLEQAYVALLPETTDETRRKIVIPHKIQAGAEAAIVAKGLTRRFGNFTAVDNVDFEIKRGEIFGFLGSNGCGKTTTMKMLTGLLSPTAGKAFLFDKAVDAGSAAMRRRVGYMSQSFSLYGELTVQQNLNLHARLFHIETDKARKRIAEISARFGLQHYFDELAAGLPLGVRQRLSLAVAILHKPEMLILDEPTSGVDPLARNEFWRLLGELSRQDNVTIFVSTHFMSEAMRCDRISLMHAGKVLAIGTPEELILSKEAKTLDAAFIAYMQEAEEETPEVKNFAPEDTLHSSGGTKHQTSITRSVRWPPYLSNLSLARLWAYTMRETMEVLRDPIRLSFAFFGSTLLLFIFSYGITTDVEEVTFAVFDQDHSPASRAYASSFSSSRYFLRRSPIVNKEDLDRRLINGRITVALEIPPSFGRQLKRGGKPQVSAWIDGSNTVRAATIEGYVEGVHANFLREWTRRSGQRSPAPGLADIATRYLYNPTFESIYAIGPAVPAMLLILFPAILMAISVVREKEIGTITNFYVTPSHRLEFLIGKQIPYIGITVLSFLTMSAIVIFVFGIPLKGSFLALFIGALVYAAATTGYGLLIATFTSSQVAAVFATAILSIMPTFLFSGFLLPVSSLEGGARILGTLWPTTYYMHLSVGAYTKGLGFADLAGDIVALMAFVPVFIAVAAFFLRKQES